MPDREFRMDKFDRASAESRFRSAEFGATYRRLHRLSCNHLDGRRPGERGWDKYPTIWLTRKQAVAWLARDRSRYSTCRECQPDVEAPRKK